MRSAVTEARDNVELTFVAGTGCCGSTMLPRILREHPDVLSMSEFFGILRLASLRAACEPGTRALDSVAP